jgi:hypothetical protein
MVSAPAQREQIEPSRLGLHWEARGDDISIAGLIAGRGDTTHPPDSAAWRRID